MTHEPPAEPQHEAAGISRRTLLQGAGAAAAAAAALPLLQEAVAQEAEETPAVALRHPATLAATRRDTEPALPPIGVIAFQRMAYGPRTADELSRMQTMTDSTFEAFVDEQLNPDTIDDSELEQRLAAAGFRTLDKPLSQLWQDHRVNADTPPLDFDGSSWDWRNLPATEMELVTFLRAVYSNRQLAEVLFDFWFNHFNVFAARNGSYAASTLTSYIRDALRANMLGNFRTMLEAVATSPAMLEYLDNYINSAAGPNENYAREIFELHTMGAENYYGSGRQESVPGFDEGSPIAYVDGDVYEATRAFTGWRVADGRDDTPNTGEFLYYDQWHDRFRKVVLGTVFQPNQAEQKDGRDVMDLLVAHPGTGRSICRKLCRRFISDNPPERVVNAAAAVFTAQKDAPDQLRQVMRVILLSPEFRATWGEKVKRPFEVAVSALRAIRADFKPSMNRHWFWAYDATGQRLFAWGPPDGYPDEKAYWSSTMPMLHRWRLMNTIIEEGIRDLRDNETEKYINVNIVQQTTARTANSIIDYWIDRILGRPMNSAERQMVVDFLAQGRNPDFDLPTSLVNDLLPRAVALILMSPDFNWR